MLHQIPNWYFWRLDLDNVNYRAAWKKNHDENTMQIENMRGQIKWMPRSAEVLEKICTSDCEKCYRNEILKSVGEQPASKRGHYRIWIAKKLQLLSAALSAAADRHKGGPACFVSQIHISPRRKKTLYGFTPIPVTYVCNWKGMHRYIKMTQNLRWCWNVRKQVRLPSLDHDQPCRAILHSGSS